MKVAELREIAKAKKIKNWWKLSKADLTAAIEGVTGEVHEFLKVVKKEKINTENIDTETIEKIADDNEIILRENELKEVQTKLKSKGMKVVYAEKDGKIHVMKDYGGIWPLWYKYKNLGYKNIMAFEYQKVFGDKPDTNKRTIKKSEFIKNNANPDVNLIHEEFDKGGKTCKNTEN